MPLSESGRIALETQISNIKDVLSGKSDKFLLIIGPCSADREDAVLDYIYRLRGVQEKVRDRIIILPRVYTNKPRSNGDGYKGMLHQPNPNEAPDLLKGIIAIRKIHLRAIEETGFSCADEMLYPENHRYLSDLLAYVAVGARSAENQQHRQTASGLNVPVGMKNSTGGDERIMINSVKAAQTAHTFLYRGWEVKTEGNPYAHLVIRGYTDKNGELHSNYHLRNIESLYALYNEVKLQNPAVIVDTSHANSGKNPLKQIAIADEVIRYRKESTQARELVKGLMIESYIEDGAQQIGDDLIYGKSVTDPCLGWEKTERLIYDIAESL